jgi:hypothetical protein
MPQPAELDALLDGLDESLAPLDTSGAVVDDTKKKDDDVEDTSDDTSDTSDKTDAGDDVADDDNADDNKDEDDEGFTIGDLDEDKPDDKPDTTVESTKTDTSGLTPEQRFIYDGLPTISVYDKEGKSYSVKTYAELPADFEFPNKQHELAFINNMNAQENNARELQRTYTQEQVKIQQQEWEAKEQLADKLDIEELQKAGELPKFKVKQSDAGFSDTAEAKLIQSVLNYKDELNKENYERSQKNNTVMRMVGFREAFALYNYRNKGADTTKPKDDKLDAEDKARKNLATRTSKTTSTDAKVTQPRPELRSQRDIYNFIDSLE